MNITICTGVWKRPEVFKLFAKGVKNLPYNIRVIVSGSEGVTSRRLVTSEGFEYIEKRNKPLSNKMNAATQAAKGSDYVICMGSDDIITPEVFALYMRYMKRGYEFIGLEDLYFYDLRSSKALYWAGYSDHRKGLTVGAGRCISANVMESWNWKPWDDGLNKYLDSSMTAKMNVGKSKSINLKKNGLIAVDLKSKINITPFSKWENAEYINPEIITEKLPYLK